MTRLSLIAVLLLGASPALAGGATDAPVPAPVALAAPSASDWTGGYIGLQVESLDGSSPFGGSFDGQTFGLFGGYRHDFGSIVLGGEIDYMVGEITQGAASIDVDSLLRLGVDLGYDAGPALIYATAGFARLEASAGAASGDDSGSFYGIGADLRVSDAVTVGLELLRHRFEDFDGTAGNDVDFTTIGINVAYRF